MILLDSYALVEIFDGSKKGAETLRLVKEEQQGAYVSVLSLYEVGYTVEGRVGWEGAQEYLMSIQNSFNILEVERRICLAALSLRRYFKLPAMDCLIYSTARSVNAKIVTGCKHFKAIADQDDVIIL